jgi:FkbM family methyltransferase
LRLDPRRLARSARARLRRLAAPPAGEPTRPSILSLEEIATLPRDQFEEACRRVASPVYLGDRVGLCRLLTRYKFHVATDDVGFGANVLLDGYWESWLTRFIAGIVPRGGTVVDVGANCGYYSMLLADLVGPEGRLYAVEPNPPMARLLRRSIDLNGFTARTTLCEVALGAEDGGAASLFVPEGEPKNAALGGDGGRPGERHEVAVRTLDALLAAEGRIDFVKIDAEGGEEEIIAGMRRVCGLFPPPMVLEFNAARYPDPGAFLDKLLRLYGRLAHVGFDGRAEPLTPGRVLDERRGEDWLLFLRRA